MSCSARRGSTELELAVKKFDFKNKKLNALARTCISEFTRSCVGGWLITRMCTITRAHTHTGDCTIMDLLSCPWWQPYVKCFVALPQLM